MDHLHQIYMLDFWRDGLEIKRTCFTRGPGFNSSTYVGHLTTAHNLSSGGLSVLL